jgi:hypothetical protein
MVKAQGAAIDVNQAAVNMIVRCSITEPFDQAQKNYNNFALFLQVLEQQRGRTAPFFNC